MQCHLDLKIVPNSSRDEIVGWLGDCLKIKVVASPEKGKANQAVIKLLSKRLELSESVVVILKGSTSPRKLIRIDGVSMAQLREALAEG